MCAINFYTYKKKHSFNLLSHLLIHLTFIHLIYLPPHHQKKKSYLFSLFSFSYLHFLFFFFLFQNLKYNIYNLKQSKQYIYICVCV
ncbi:hypothetical protein J3Q64DRAFT_1744308 [Phycomyces blakesleeanus]|uniref:Uncharacterized protein n=1 Tax=Phycomyces blakesleeanus TaxID=4837 RepID=A0ABR3AZN2_PHYBL